MIQRAFVLANAISARRRCARRQASPWPRRARQAIRPEKAGGDIEARRAAVLEAPDTKEAYTHYRGEYLPDEANGSLNRAFTISASSYSPIVCSRWG